ncbi:uncharacterized protein BDV17DRAFT_267296 [Aspergillus undulatus]|uniref:uncharacterized protein n=1 Tax=Aspergillus undulatus TaxID=1810928 RepID=UPI003CCCCDCD
MEHHNGRTYAMPTKFIFCHKQRIALVFKDREQKQSLFYFILFFIFIFYSLFLLDFLFVFAVEYPCLPPFCLQFPCTFDWRTRLCSSLHRIVKRGLCYLTID